MSHTPGPWGYVYDGSSVWSVGRDADPQDARIAAVQKCSVGESGWHEAADNAQLIAAAPDLLAALKSMLHEARRANADYHHVTAEELFALAEAAIAKAEGR